MVEILIAAVSGGVAGACAAALWFARRGRERRSGGSRRAAAARDPRLAAGRRRRLRPARQDRVLQPGGPGDPRRAARGDGAGERTWEPLDDEARPLPEEARPAAITARTGEPCVGVDIGLRRADGGVRWTTVSTARAVATPAENGRYSVVVAFTDITARREALQALERSNAELAQFAYVASHDLSEPLRMVSSYLQLLRRRYHGQIDEDADEFIDFAVEGANRMRALIEDLLAYSRAGRGAEPRPVDLGPGHGRRAVLAGGGRRRRAGEHQRGPMPAVLGDRVALAQLLQNLVANALKFRRGRAPTCG